MPRLARTVFAGIPHHVTQRGNRREKVFFSDDDRRTYLSWLKVYADRHELDVLAYCLMTNHVHLVLVPPNTAALHRALRPLHMRYAQHVNRAKGWKGHLWQGRFFSSALDEAYLRAAIRYVECNPVRARMVEKAEAYPWSSAGAHCGLRLDPVLTTKVSWREALAEIRNWSAWLAQGEEAPGLETLRRHADKGLPCGSAAFIESLERQTKRPLRERPQGRPKAKGDATLFR